MTPILAVLRSGTLFSLEEIEAVISSNRAMMTLEATDCRGLPDRLHQCHKYSVNVHYGRQFLGHPNVCIIITYLPSTD